MVKNKIISAQSLIQTIEIIEDDYLGLIYKIFIVKVIKESYSVTFKNDCFNIDHLQGKNKQNKVDESKGGDNGSGNSNKNQSNVTKNGNKNTNNNSNSYSKKHTQNNNDSKNTPNSNKTHSTDLLIEISKSDIFI